MENLDFEDKSEKYGKGINYVSEAYMKGVKDAFEWHRFSKDNYHSPDRIGWYLIRIKKRNFNEQISDYDYFVAFLNYESM